MARMAVDRSRRHGGEEVGGVEGKGHVVRGGRHRWEVGRSWEEGTRGVRGFCAGWGGKDGGR